MATYPGGIYSPRAKENKAGVVYDAAKKTIGYVEDVTKLDDEVVAIETELGTDPKGNWPDVETALRKGAKVGATLIVAAVDSEEVNRADYICDGANDEVQINQAITDLPAAGGRVLLLEGNYSIGAIITILRNDVILEGQGFGTKITAANTSNLDRVIGVGDGGATPYLRIQVKNLYVDGNGANQDAGFVSHPIYVNGASASKIEYVLIKNCYLTGTKAIAGTQTAQLKIYQGRNVAVKDCFFVGSVGNVVIGLWLRWSYYVTISGCVTQTNDYGIYAESSTFWTYTGNVSYSDNWGVYTNSSRYYTINGNSLNNNAVAGVRVNGKGYFNITGNWIYFAEIGIHIYSEIEEFTEYGSIIGNSFYRIGSEGIVVDGSNFATRHITISGNNLYYIGTHGIRLTSSSENIISNNLIKRASYDTTNTYYSIYLDSGAVRFAERNVITGNNLIGDATRQAKYHIWENNANSDFNLISNNICRGGGTLDIVINGKSTNAFNNQVSTPYHEQRILNYKNTFGFDLGEGTVVILKSVAAGNEVDLTEVQGNDKVLGIVADEILDGAYGGIKVLGLTTLLSVNGVADIAIGDFLGTYTQFGVSMKAAAGDMAYAIALEAYANNDSDGRIDALIVCPRKI